ncbi:MAG: peptidoglycan DD-metalloendopeptidase family protein, partial [Acidimicrobiales bacterium]|nr:peptidoglycan DD-metalloendopeptidase family protein [Acidimicrobiales bacterium]
MPLRRTTCLLAGLLLSASFASPADASGPVVKPIAFPVDGKVTYTDTYGAPRSGGRTHEGQDLMGAKMTRLVAAVSGEVFRLKFDNLSTGGSSVVIKGDDGWTYHYLHVNNDTPGTDDGNATRDQAFPSNIVLGARVAKGQLVGFMGDSGNAETTGAHLHFEIRQPPAPGGYTGAAINAYPSLKAAETASSGTTSRWFLRRTADTGPADEELTYGIQAGDRGLLCDWDGDGTDEIVVYRQGVWHLKDGTSTGATAGQVAFGTATDVPLCGDVDGDG